MAPAVVNDKDRTMAAVHDEPAFRLQLVKPPRKPELLVRRVHENASGSRLFRVALGTLIKRQHRDSVAQTRKTAVSQYPVLAGGEVQRRAVHGIAARML